MVNEYIEDFIEAYDVDTRDLKPDFVRNEIIPRMVGAISELGDMWLEEEGDGVHTREICALISYTKKLRDALEFLRDLKDYKNAHGKDEYYTLRQEAAWKQARAALGQEELGDG